jgi:hypothetical protein
MLTVALDILKYITSGSVMKMQTSVFQDGHLAAISLCVFGFGPLVARIRLHRNLVHELLCE